MTHETFDETDLLAGAADHGAHVSQHQLKRWRRAGLVPRPRIVHGLGKRGSSGLYPAWALEQLLAVARLHRSVRKLDDLVIAAWWEGHWVEPEKLREALIGPLAHVSDEAREARAGEHDPYEAADLILASLRDERDPSAVMALFRRRLSGRADVMDLLWTLLVLGLGGLAPWEHEDLSPLEDPAPGALQLLATATGAEQAMRDDPAGNGPWLPANFDLPQFMATLRDAGGFELDDLARPIRDATPEQLAQAREDALLFSQPLAMIGSVLQALLGKDVAVLGSLSALDTDTASGRAAMVRSMLILRELSGDEKFTSIRQLVDDVQERYAAIAQLRAALPQHEQILRGDYAEQLRSLPLGEADRVREEVTCYLREHPPLAQALGA